MKTLKNLLLGALLTLPVMTLNAGSIVDAAKGTEVRPVRSVANCCYVQIGTRWYCVPC
jgi:hypothetical protein